MRIHKPMQFVCIALLALPAGLEAHAIQSDQSAPSVAVGRSARHTLESAKVGDSFVIQIRLPTSYARGQKSYPVLYVLDGERCFGLAADTADWLAWAKEAPEIIVVGIAYEQERDWWQKRSRDLTPTKDAGKLWGEWPLAGGAAKFQDFLAGELFPFVESRYRALADDRAVVGISFGGLFGAFSLLTRPTHFQRYILISPALAWDNRRLWQYEAEYGEKSKALAATVFTAVGDGDDPTRIVTPWREFNRLMEDRHYGGLRWLTQIYPDESHISVLPGAISRGIRRVYSK
jgi:predicted alpha/beta superfamily hydrolase